MKNKTPTKMGMNRTGIDMSPLDAQAMQQGAETLTPPSPGNSLEMAEARIDYIKEAEPVGKVPAPGTSRGLVQAGLQMLKGNRAQVLIDKLGERLAFERTGTRLYEGLLSKHQGSGSMAALPPLERLQQFRDEEYQHFQLVKETVRELGADPTAMTPAADMAGVSALGLVQIINDPRTTFAQSLHAILIAELADHDGWELLIGLCEEAGLDRAAESFRQCLAEEKVHLSSVRDWVKQLAVAEASVMPEAAGKAKVA